MMNKNRKHNAWALCLLAAIMTALTVFNAPATPQEHPPAAGFRIDWQPLFKGIDYARVCKDTPDPQAVHAARIDLTEPGIAFLVTPLNGDKPLETDGQKTSTFLKGHKCQVAINASPFWPVKDEEGKPRDILGLAVSRGDVYSTAHKQNAAMLISRDNKVRFSRPPFDTQGVDNAAGGFGMLLEDGRNVGGEGERHPRTAAGLSKDSRYLYLLVIDGRQEGYSMGATTAETAEWLMRFGAHNALNLDGGGSTALVVSDGPGRAKVLNRPIHNGIPGNERVNGNNLGVFAHPLEK